MIPYVTCMRFNQRKRSSLGGLGPSGSSGGDAYNPNEWTLVQHQYDQEGESTVINISSQDDQTLCFTWTIDSQNREKRDSLCSLTAGNMMVTSAEIAPEMIEEVQSTTDDKNVYLLLTLRRRKSLLQQANIHSETISLLDLCYYGITQRYLRQSYYWNFNTFSLDMMTGGHSLSSLLIYLFKEYGLIETFKLDLINVMRCFYYLENGYHDTNPYHNSVHAADVTQAMHCFLQESKIKNALTQMEIMCALMAAVAHDLDHPGVNQNFLVATNSYLASMYNNYSVLESHHWRFALSCFHESHIFDHLSPSEWHEIEYLLRHLILATDISRQHEYIAKFRLMQSGRAPGTVVLTTPDERHFILQIALKCADLGNPCRPWNISKKWSEQICNEFYRQGDFERQLNLPVTAICDRRTASIPKIQQDFFTNIVRPLFVLWHSFLDSPLSRKLMNNLNFNNYMWNTMDDGKTIRKIMRKRRNSASSLVSFCSLPGVYRARSKSLGDLSLSSTTSSSSASSSRTGSSSGESLESFKAMSAAMAAMATSTKPKAEPSEDLEMSVDASSSIVEASRSQVVPEMVTVMKKRKKKKCRHGSDNMLTFTRMAIDVPMMEDYQEEDDHFIMDRFNDDCGAILSTPALLLPNYYHEKAYYSKGVANSRRRGSAPGCMVDITRNELNASKMATATMYLLRNTSGQFKAPSVGQHSHHHGHKHRRSSFPVSVKKMSSASGVLASIVPCPPSTTARGHSFDFGTIGGRHYRHRKSSGKLFCTPGQNPLSQPVFLPKNRRGSVPQDIFISSLNNFNTAH